jgi:predicted DNA-binding ribbon-helix-helix protein
LRLCQSSYYTTQRGVGLEGVHYVERLERTKRQRPYKRSIKIDGHLTSVSLEDGFWDALNEIAASRNVPVSALIATINKDRQHANLTSVLRLFILEHFRVLASGALR